MTSGLITLVELWTAGPMQDLLWLDRPGFRFGPMELGLLLLTLAIVFRTSRARRKEGAHLMRRGDKPDSGGPQGAS